MAVPLPCRLRPGGISARAESGLPGPRGNLELLQVAADNATEPDLRRWAAIGPLEAPTNTPGEFLVACGIVGLGRLVVQGRIDFDELRPHARDDRWRVREAVAMALQRAGAADMDRLLGAAAVWSRGDRLEQRAVVAGLAEPVLLGDSRRVRAVLSMLDGITATIRGATDRGEEPFRVLRQALGYAWSVAIAALPDEGTALLDHRGRLSVTGMTGAQRLRTVSGDLALVGAGGDIRIDTTSGDASVESPADVRLDWHSLSGDLRAAAAVFRAVRLDSLSGDAWLEGALAPDDEHRARSVSGGLRIAPVGGLVADVWLISGSIRSDLPHRLDGVPGRRVLVVGTGGGPRLRFESTSGRMHVTRPSDRDQAPAGAGPGHGGQARGSAASAVWSAGTPTGADGGTGTPAPDHAFGDPIPGSPPATDRPSIEVDQLEVLRAVERGTSTWRRGCAGCR